MMGQQAADQHTTGSGTSPPSVRYQPLVLVLTNLVIGAILDRHLPQTVSLWLVASVLALTLWFACAGIKCSTVASCCLCGSLIGVGGAGHHSTWHLADKSDLGFAVGETPQPVCLRVKVLRSPRRIDSADPARGLPSRGRLRSRLTVRVVSVRDGNVWRTAMGQGRLTVRGELLGIDTGDTLETLASVAAAPLPKNAGEFDWHAYERAQGRRFTLNAQHPACVRVIQEGSPWLGSALVNQLRGQGLGVLHHYVGGAQVPLASAILLGAREQLDSRQTESFFTSGTIHLLAISGLHVGILAWALLLAARMLMIPRTAALLSVSAFVILYALLTDARPPVVRAAILILILCGARWLSRPSSGFNALAGAGIIVFFYNPAQVFQTGTQLSFLAVATLIVLAPRLRQHTPTDPLDVLIRRTRPWPQRALQQVAGGLFRLWVTTTSIWIVALPLIVYQFHLVSPVGMLLNPILWLPITATLLSGFGVLLTGWLAPPVALVCGKVCDGSLALIERCIQVTDHFPGDHFWLPAPPLWWVLGCYGFAAGFLSLPALRPPRRWCCAGLSAWIALGLATSLPLTTESQRHQQLVCTFIAVGHGTSVLLELPDGRTLLYDAGRLGSPASAARIISGVLWSRRRTHLDAVVLSHADADHYNAIPELLDRFSVGVVYVSPMMFDREDAGLADLAESIERAGVPIRQIRRGDQLAPHGAARIQVLHPAQDVAVGNDNAHSLVLLIEYAGRRILLPGDLELGGLNDLMLGRRLDCDVLMAPHHGSTGSNLTGLAQWSRPESVVVSSGSALHRDVVAEYEAVGAKVYHTDRQGSVRFTINRQAMMVSTWRGDR